MTRDPRYDALFEPIQIGPVTAKNRFYQVPHCTGMGNLRPHTLAEMRGIKAEGGWGVVNTEYCSIHPSSDDIPHPYATMWDKGDIKAHALMTDKVHEHGALAGVELWYSGWRSANLLTRETSMEVDHLPNANGFPFQTRKMDKADIKELRRWHRNAALRAKEAGFDIVYVYATHGYLLSHFLSAKTNTRTDEYGGSVENRTRLIREIIEDTKDAVGDTCAVAVRFSSDEKHDQDGVPIHGEHRDMFGILGEYPDLWDINIQDYSYEMGHSRFVKEGSLEPYMSYVRSVTTKPIVTVGRFTSPDTMASQIKRGIVDLVGTARPSIADPFIPNKIDENRLEDIRECIGCNICYTGDSLGSPIRCTQNPTMGEEWRRGWHPEKIEEKSSDSSVLIVGAGPAGLEAAHALGKRGYDVTLAEATRELGGRVTRESALPGLSEWVRVRDYRIQQLDKLTNVEIYRESNLGVDDILAFEADHVCLATGATWRTDKFDGEQYLSVTSGPVFTPDDIMNAKLPEGPTIIFDADHYYMSSVIAERLINEGVPVTLVTADDVISAWGTHTAERWRVRTHLMALGVDIVTSHDLKSFDGEVAVLSCEYSGKEKCLAAKNLVMVSQRLPNDSLYQDLMAHMEQGGENLPKSVKRIGDCDAPAIIASAIHAGHKYARELDTVVDPDNPFKHDRIFSEGNDD